MVLAHAFVCGACAHVCAGELTQGAHVEASDSHRLFCFLLCFMRSGLLGNPEPSITSGLAGHQTPRMFVFVTPALGSQTSTPVAWLSQGCWGTQNEVCGASTLPTGPSSLSSSFNFGAFHILRFFLFCCFVLVF